MNMRVAMYYNNHDIRVEEMPVPEIGPDELLMRTEASGICGSDVLEWYRLKKAPLVLGHEVAGQVVKIGDKVTRFKVGDRIVANHHVPCNTCSFCLTGHHTACNTLRTTNFEPGGFSEYIRIPAINVDRGTFLIPNELTYEEATFHEPLGCVIRAKRMAALKPGQSILVLGSGIAGILILHYARQAGAGLILAVEPVASRRKAALKFGANEAISPLEDIPAFLRKINRGRLADMVFISTGAEEPQSQALKCVERGGTVVYFAPTASDVKVPVSVNDLFFRNDITLTTSYGCAPYDSFLALELMRWSELKIKEMITHRLPLAETSKGFQMVAAAGDSLKVIIEPQK
jgi:L-iditol 2-dehydrogenase